MRNQRQAMPTKRSKGVLARPGFSFFEVLAAVTLVGIVSVIVITRTSFGGDEAKKNACFATKGNIEVQAQRWYRDTGSWPASNLSDIGADSSYLPDGLPVCPYDGSSYTFDSSSQQVTGHNH